MTRTPLPHTLQGVQLVRRDTQKREHHGSGGKSRQRLAETFASQTSTHADSQTHTNTHTRAKLVSARGGMNTHG